MGGRPVSVVHKGNMPDLFWPVLAPVLADDPVFLYSRFWMFRGHHRQVRFLFGLSDILLIALAFQLAYATRLRLELEHVFYIESTMKGPAAGLVACSCGWRWGTGGSCTITSTAPIRVRFCATPSASACWARPRWFCSNIPAGSTSAVLLSRSSPDMPGCFCVCFA